MAFDEPTRYHRWYGRNTPPAPNRRITVGDLSLIVDGVDLRRVTFGGVAIMDRVFVGVRDVDWGTVPPTLEAPWEIMTDASAGRIDLAFRAHHIGAGIRFAWQGRISVGPGPTLAMEMDGVAGAGFRYARIGLCALLPASSTAGRPIVSRSDHGEPRRDVLPSHIGPQLIVDGVDQPLIPAFRELEVALPDGLLRVDFEGDEFELEDQRNWTDDSFKAYSLMAGERYPRTARPDQRFRQRVTLTVAPPAAEAPGSSTSRPAPAVIGPVGDDRSNHATVHLTDESLHWPAIGLGAATEGPPLDDMEAAALRALRLDHVRVDVRPGDPDWQDRSRSAARDVRAVGAGLELALSLDEHALDESRSLPGLVEETPIARVLVFHRPTQGTATTPPGWVARARQLLGPAAPGARWIIGTDGDFAEINRDRPLPGGPDGADGVCYAMNPQIHASDETSMSETLPVQGETVVTARTWFPAGDVCTTPVTLRQRFNPAALAEERVGDRAEGLGPDDVLPVGVDRRQRSLYGAGWTLGSIASLTAAGATSGTWHQTVGWRGLLERSRPPARPGWGDVIPGEIYPVYLVFADVADRDAWDPVRCMVGSSRDVVALGMRAGSRCRVLLANLAATVVDVRITGLPAGRARSTVLDALTPTTTLSGTLDRRTRAILESRDGGLDVRLAPFAMVRIDTPV
jgi:D-apionolactonase